MGLVGYGEAVVGRVELDGVVDAGRGERVVEQVGLFGGEGGAFLCAGDVDGGADVVGGQVRAGWLVGDGESAAVEGGRCRDRVAESARIFRPESRCTCVRVRRNR